MVFMDYYNHFQSARSPKPCTVYTHAECVDARLLALCFHKHGEKRSVERTINDASVSGWSHGGEETAAVLYASGLPYSLRSRANTDHRKRVNGDRFYELVFL